FNCNFRDNHKDQPYSLRYINFSSILLKNSSRIGFALLLYIHLSPKTKLNLFSFFTPEPDCPIPLSLTETSRPEPLVSFGTAKVRTFFYPANLFSNFIFEASKHSLLHLTQPN